MISPGSRNIRGAYIFVLVVALLGISASLQVRLARADAIAIAPGGLGLAPVALAAVTGPGAVCARAEVANPIPPGGTTSDPAAGAGMPCSDMSMIGPAGALVPIKSQLLTTRNGDRAAGVFGGAGGVARGRALNYNVTSNNDKPAAARAAANVFTMTQTANVAVAPTTADATATQTITTPAAGGGGVMGLATATVTTAPGMAARAALAIGIVNDPLEIALLDPSLSGRVDFTIGSGIRLQADEEGDFAAVLYELGVGSDTLLSFEMAIDFLTSSLQEIDFTFFDFDMGLGFPDEAAFVNFLIDGGSPFLSLDPMTHVLTASAEIPLFHLDIPAGSAPVVVTYIYEAIGGSAIPEPGTGLLLCAGLIGLLGYPWYRQKRAKSAHTSGSV